MADNKLVYSTESGDQRKSKEQKSPAAIKPADKSLPIKMRLETAGRGGKAVTVIFETRFSESEGRAHLSKMQSQFGCGGAYKDGHLELRGDVRTKVEGYFGKLGIKVVRAGG